MEEIEEEIFICILVLTTHKGRSQEEKKVNF